MNSKPQGASSAPGLAAGSAASFSIALFLAMFAGNLSRADDISVGPSGIDALGLGVDGSGIGLGQVEPTRPGDPFLDSPANSHPSVFPFRVYLRNGPAVANANTNNHAEQVAGVMISKDAVGGGGAAGVAPTAFLFASADNGMGPNFDPFSAVSAQHVINEGAQLGHPLRAINYSFGNPLFGGATLNGNSLLTQFVDWSARQFDVLHVVAGNEGGGGIPVPTDEFNGMTIAYSQQVGGVFRRVNAGNLLTEDAVGARRSVDLMAPGTNINMPVRGGGYAMASGTSFAAPHVTGTVALLQEFAETRIAAAVPRFDADARQHELMKAVLMNSADKLQDAGDGLRLGMTRTALDSAGNDWLASDAFTDRSIPLDLQMGTGHLNARRGLQQFSPGEYDSFGTATVPAIGWDVGLTLAPGDINKYVFDKPLAENSFLSITLAWDRVVDLNDFGADGTMDTRDAGENNGSYDIGENFTTVGLTDMDLILHKKGALPTDVSVWSSVSNVDSVEHIFFQIPEAGEYEFWVHQFGATAGGGFQEYAVAWWAVVPEPSALLLLTSGVLALLFGWRNRPTG